VLFLLNALIFLLLGAQVGPMLDVIPPGSLGTIVRNGVLITLVAIVVRLIWVPLVTLVRRLSPERRRRSPPPRWKALFLVSWTSMRGVVSLATALALPRFVGTGAQFPYRAEIVLVTMCVIVLTLLVQGLSLAPMIRAFRFEPEKEHHEEERLARREATRRGAEALEDLSREDWVDPRDVEALRAEVRERVLSSEQHGGSFEGRRRLRLGMIDAERRMLVRLRNEDAISDEVLRALEQELDLEAIRAGAGESATTTPSRR
jgi:CPA1 family monovalent cation:H+ antiporter